IIEAATEKLFQSVKEHGGGEQDTQAYYADVEKILEPVVDFPLIARIVMGPLGKEASDEQTRQFAEVFKKGLVRSYAKGIASYIDSSINILPLEGDLEGKRRVTVRQEVRHQGSTHRLDYTMTRKKSGEWKLINLV